MKTDEDYIPALGYDSLTNFYDAAIRLTMPEKEFRHRLIDELSLKNGEKVLEFGCGTGQNLIIAKQKCSEAEICGLDIDPKVKAIAEQKIKSLNLKIPLFLYDGKEFPFADESFDKVYSSLVFHQLDRATKKHCLREIKRVLKSAGLLIIGDWGKPKSKLMRLPFYVVQLFDGLAATSDSVKGYLPKFIQEAGFRDVEEIGYLNTKIGVYCYYKGLK